MNLENEDGHFHDILTTLKRLKNYNLSVKIIINLSCQIKVLSPFSLDHAPCAAFFFLSLAREFSFSQKFKSSDSTFIRSVSQAVFFFPQTSPSAHWILHCDPEIGQRLKAINYASWCVLMERRRHNAVILFAIIPRCFLLYGELIFFPKTFPCCPLSSDTCSMSTWYFFFPCKTQ